MKINSQNFKNFKGNPFRKILKNVVSEKADFIENNKQSLFCYIIMKKVLKS